jgi:hypothetical protein
MSNQQAPVDAATIHIPGGHQISVTGCTIGQVSDGYHTFDELYEHRIALFIALAKEVNRGTTNPNIVWRSRWHSDGELAYGGGWFVLGVGQAAGHQITYHLPDSKWEQCSFAATLARAPEWDGHTSADVLDRLVKFF